MHLNDLVVVRFSGFLVHYLSYEVNGSRLAIGPSGTRALLSVDPKAKSQRLDSH